MPEFHLAPFQNIKAGFHGKREPGELNLSWKAQNIHTHTNLSTCMLKAEFRSLFLTTYKASLVIYVRTGFTHTAWQRQQTLYNNTKSAFK